MSKSMAYVFRKGIEEEEMRQTSGFVDYLKSRFNPVLILKSQEERFKEFYRRYR